MDGPETIFDRMEGRRVSADVLPCDYEPGDYGKRGDRWFICLPTGVQGHLDGRWTVIEHEDGSATLGDPPGQLCSDDGVCRCQGGPTITVAPSIWDTPQGWHGWLDHGVWRAA